MKSLILSLGVLLIGYFTYGRLMEKVFSPDTRTTPAHRLKDGVDFVPFKS